MKNEQMQLMADVIDKAEEIRYSLIRERLNHGGEALLDEITEYDNAITAFYASISKNSLDSNRFLSQLRGWRGE